MSALIRLGLIWLIVWLPHLLLAQHQPGTKLPIRRSTSPIVLDGVLDEPAWETAFVADGWYSNFPVDTVPPEFGTVARLTFDETFLYVSFVCQDDSTPDLINSLRRDFDYDLNDNASVIIGPYNDRLNGFYFSITPAGVQLEGLLSSGGANGGGYNDFWDNKWFSKVLRHSDHWVAEIAIPFKSFRYKSGLDEWKICLVRADRKRNVKSSWIQTPIQFNPESFAYSAQLLWEDPAPKAGINASLIPYVAGRGATDQQAADPSLQTNAQVGFDGKLGITPSLNLDVTVNPDFSQVEVDQQVINLTRFEIRLPERRQFFLENSDLLDQAGFPGARPFFSRRVGLVQDSLGLFQPVPILYGARLSGSITPKWRINMLNMQTREAAEQGLPRQNFTAGTVQRNFAAQSSIALTLVNKQSLGLDDLDSSRYFHESLFQEVRQGDSSILQLNRFHRSATVDLELLSRDNRWYHSSFVSRSFANYADANPYAASAFFRFSDRRWTALMGGNFVGEDYFAEAGFVPSQGVYPGQLNFFAEGQYKHFATSGPLVFMGPTLNVSQTYIPAGDLTDREYTLSYEFNFLSTAQLEFNASYVFQRLTRSFNPVDASQFIRFEEGEAYDWYRARIRYQSNTRRLFNLNVGMSYGGFYNGTNLNVNGQLIYRYQPFGNVSLQVDYNNVQLAEGYGADQLFLIGPRVDLTLTDAIFITTYVQYNSRLDNLNLNARFQWRYRPASDFFIVYTENYLPEDLSSKNRALVFKLVYWLNL